MTAIPKKSRKKSFFLPSAFENRNRDFVPLHRQFESDNLRAHEKKITGPRGSEKSIEMRQGKVKM
jgi:hypothetical protein